MKEIERAITARYSGSRMIAHFKKKETKAAGRTSKMRSMLNSIVIVDLKKHHLSKLYIEFDT